MDAERLIAAMQNGPTREVAEFLDGIDAAGPLAVPMLIDAVFRLAVEVDRITPRVIDSDGGPVPGSAPVNRPLSAHYLTPADVAALRAARVPNNAHDLQGQPDGDMSAAKRLRLLLLGLHDMQLMISSAFQNHASAEDTLSAVAVRLATLRDVHAAAMDAADAAAAGRLAG